MKFGKNPFSRAFFTVNAAVHFRVYPLFVEKSTRHHFAGPFDFPAENINFMLILCITCGYI
jgi:hypothetical protein